jgi:acetylserotonin O-methyltransferase
MHEEPIPDANPDPRLVLETLEAFRRSKAMFAGVRLGIFDALADGPAPAPALAERLGCHPAALARLLNALAAMRLLHRTGEQYANTPAANAFLVASSPQRMTGYVNFANDVSWRLWGAMEDCVRTGQHAWQPAFGWDGPIFDHLFSTPAAQHEFLMGMHGFGLLSSPVVAAAFDFSPFRHVVDLGGASGHLAAALCRRNPQLRGTVFDLPAVVPFARARIAEAGLAERIEAVAGDFFAAPLPPADLYALGRILHDWTDDKCLHLVRKIHAALPPGGGLLIAEKLLHEGGAGPRSATLQDLTMLATTEGRERSLAEYAALLAEAGFAEVHGAAGPAPVDGVLARKR